MLKVLAACGNGMGSSQVIKLRIEQVLKELKIDHKVDHASVGEAKGQAKGYDLIIVGRNLVGEFQNIGDKTKVIGLINLMSINEIREKIKEALNV